MKATRLPRRAPALVALAVLALLLPGAARAAGPVTFDSSLDPARLKQLNQWQSCAVMRVAPDGTAPAGYRVLQQAKEPDEGWVWDFVAAVQEVKRFHALGPPFPDALQIRFHPELAVRLDLEDGTRTVLLDFSCDRLRLLPDTASTCGWITSVRTRFLDLARRAFPADSTLRAVPAELPLAGRTLVTTADGRDTLQVEDLPAVAIRYEPVLPPHTDVRSGESTVELRVLVDPEGHPRAIEITRGAAGLKVPALNAVRRWVWRPGTFRGKPVAAWVEETLEFGRDEGD